ncbi:MAG: DUF1573 domain-containing protein [Saprospiraceae bacterium]
MKIFLPILALNIFLFTACQNDEGVKRMGGGPNSELVHNPATAGLPSDTNMLARIVFEESEFDFGTATEGDIVKHDFAFTNTGKVPLTILNAKSTCGCTVPERPEDPIPPGGTGAITARFNTDGKPNDQRKRITITANTYPNETRVVLTGHVTPTKEN